jgi:peptide-methionine (R)-S-oxide reductase
MSILSGILLYVIYEVCVPLNLQPNHVTANAGGSMPKEIPDQIVPVRKPEVQWKKNLPPLTYKVMRECGTERAFSGAYWEFKGQGIYHCAACHLPLFDASEQYYPGSGWADFHRPIRNTRLKIVIDKKLNAYKESDTPPLLVGCARCNGYLGKLFQDGNSQNYPKRYCINNAGLVFVAKKEFKLLIIKQL